MFQTQSLFQNPEFIPKLASDYLETYFKYRRMDIATVLNNNPMKIFRRNTAISKVIKDLSNDSSIIIVNADKNLGIVVMDRLDYEKEALRQLDITTYQQINEQYPSMLTIVNKLKEILQRYNILYELNSNNKLTKFAKYVLQAENKPFILAKFYLTIKIHKTPNVGRPICSSIGTITHHASKFLDRFLQPLARNTNFYVKNSFDFLMALEDCTVTPDCVILTCDVVSLYPSIDLIDGLVQLRRALILAKAQSKIIDLLVDLCQWVLQNNYIEFGDTVWLITKGTAMGTPLSVCFSIIYLAMLELDIMEL